MPQHARATTLPGSESDQRRSCSEAHGVESKPTGSGPSGSLVTRVAPYLSGIVLLLLIVRSLSPIHDPDTFWHIRAGQLLLSDWHFVRNPAEYSASAERPWIFNQWLPQLVLRSAEVVAGLPGVAWLFTAGVAVLMYLCWRICRRWSDPLVAALVMTLTYLSMSGSLAPRPQLVTFGLVLVTCSAWLKTEKDGQVRWWLVPLTWVWSMCHGLWLMGPVIGAATVLGIAIARLRPASVLWRMALVPVLSGMVVALTPVGPSLLLSPLQVGDVTRYISEWQPVTTTEPVLLGFMILSMPVLVRVIRHPSRVLVPQALLLLLGYVLAFTYARTIAVAAALIAPLAASALQSLVRRPRAATARFEQVIAVAAIGCALVVTGVLAPSVAAREDYGARDVNGALSTLPAGSVVCNEWEWGGWMTYRHPTLLVTMDPRVELYTPQHIEQYFTFVKGEPGWSQYVRDNKCGYGLLETNRATVALLEDRGWTVLEQGKQAVLLKAPARV